MSLESTTLNGPKYPEYSKIQDSCLFRRGRNMASPDEGFVDVVNAVESVPLPSEGKISILEVGVARGEELLSVLAVLNAQAKTRQKNLEDIANVQVVDIRPPLLESEIIDTAPGFIIESFFEGRPFIKDSLEPTGNIYYKVKDPIKKFLVEQLKGKDNPQYWQTDVRDFIELPVNKNFDVILYNNTHYHILPEDLRKDEVIVGLLRRLNVSGVLITDPTNNAITDHPRSAELIREFNLEEQAPGIYKRTA